MRTALARAPGLFLAGGVPTCWPLTCATLPAPAPALRCAGCGVCRWDGEWPGDRSGGCESSCSPRGMLSIDEACGAMPQLAQHQNDLTFSSLGRAPARSVLACCWVQAMAAMTVPHMLTSGAFSPCCAQDCGGGTCPTCADGKLCSLGADCQSLVCSGSPKTCQVGAAAVGAPHLPACRGRTRSEGPAYGRGAGTSKSRPGTSRPTRLLRPPCCRSPPAQITSRTAPRQTRWVPGACASHH